MPNEDTVCPVKVGDEDLVHAMMTNGDFNVSFTPGPNQRNSLSHS